MKYASIILLIFIFAFIFSIIENKVESRDKYTICEENRIKAFAAMGLLNAEQNPEEPPSPVPTPAINAECIYERRNSFNLYRIIDYKGGYCIYIIDPAYRGFDYSISCNKLEAGQ
jgi:hypothetical protein